MASEKKRVLEAKSVTSRAVVVRSIRPKKGKVWLIRHTIPILMQAPSIHRRILSRGSSTADVAQRGSETFRDDDELEITPPGTPVALSTNPASPSHADHILKTHSSILDVENTPPGTPLLGAATLKSKPISTPNAGPSRPLPETTRVKEMRERVQEMTTGDDPMVDSSSSKDQANASITHSSPPPPDVETEIAHMPASAAAAEHQQNGLTHGEGDVIISEPDNVENSSAEADRTRAAYGLPPSAPLTAPAVNALGRSSSLIPPPSPASSVRAETGSVAGDNDYIGDQSANYHFQAPVASRQSSMSSMRSVHASGSSSLSAPHPLVSSALPRSSSATGFDIASDALSDISTEVNPPETPRPLAEADSTSTPLLAGVSGSALYDSGNASLPASPSITARGPAYTSVASKQASGGSTGDNKLGTVQANFGRPMGSFASSSGASSSSAASGSGTPASKGYSNPFASFGSSSSASPFASKTSTTTTATSNLSTAKPFGSGFATTSAASPFTNAATSSGKASAFDKPASKESEADTDDTEGTQSPPDSNKLLASGIPLVTGEEDEYVQYSLPRCKLFVLDDKEWKERGVGTLHLNSRTDGEKLAVRLVMRAEAVHRLILNVNVYAQMTVTLSQDKFIRFSAFEEGSIRHYTIRVSNAAQGKELHEQIKDMIDLLGQSGSASGEA
ncbi:hypothetical protein EMMF5_004388 [Cystobasidiomycetes sp. EMM_F5]